MVTCNFRIEIIVSGGNSKWIMLVAKYGLFYEKCDTGSYVCVKVSYPVDTAYVLLCEVSV